MKKTVHLSDKSPPNLGTTIDKGSILFIRITPYETKRVNELKEKYQISDREIFEILCHGDCGGEVITGVIKRGRVGCQIKKIVEIPRNILTKKKT